MQRQKKWEILAELNQQGNTCDEQEVVRIILRNRGITTEEEKQVYLHPSLNEVTVDSVGIDTSQLEKTIARLKAAYEKKEGIVVYGDYDVDGITGTAVLWETLHQLGLHALPYIPHRTGEGYGLSIKGIEKILETLPQTKLIITVDNGIVAGDAVVYAGQKGIDVIITDHHTMGDSLPAAYSIVHTTKLCGASVAWILSREIKKNFQKDENITQHLDLIALATVADLVPLTGKNRVILKHGLPFLRKTERVGLQALFQEAGIDPEHIGVYEIGHVIGPRINAMGRLESAMDSLRLLCTKDSKKAADLAGRLGTTNRERQLLTQSRSQHAKDLVSNEKYLKNILVISHEMYEEGIIGLIAGKLVEEYYRPAIVIAKGEKISKASARSVTGFNIIEFIRSAKHHLLNAGGHPMAAGFTLDTEKIPLLKEFLETQAVTVVTEELLTRIIKIDCLLPFLCIRQSLYNLLQTLEPFGMANPQPVFMSSHVLVEEVKPIGREKNHLKFLLADTERTMLIEAIAFSMAEKGTDIKSGDTIDIVYSLDENEWNGRKKLQLKLKDFKKSS